MNASRRLVTRSEAETLAAGRDLAAALRPGDVVLLLGNLGMGKTVFARGLAEGLGVDPEQVRSPTFTLINPYRGRIPVHHVDLYRIDAPGDLDELGLEEILGGDGVVIVEWAERLGPYQPKRPMSVRLEDRGGSERLITIEDARWKRGDEPTRSGSSALPW
ncbi:MAG TPA: tRNA (adenosine(37)-N6)-threonylcarbamoyltransferase complex ATPase subunit type 1 TsaE [Candidatus Polarisedimenticolia bacterium]|nr:tRNA (adenosine(37)-N6)-threonylcarbamoyltransferase complex ATPase subunit type 1 TsaE [Candidatus Polarisedimenticolia bacterium]